MYQSDPQPKLFCTEQFLIEEENIKRTVAVVTDCAKLKNPWKITPKDKNASPEDKTIAEPKKNFAVRACNVNVKSDTTESY